MKLTLLQYIAFAFVFGFVGGQACGFEREVCLFLGALNAFIAGYLNDAHGKFIAKIKSTLAR